MNKNSFLVHSQGYNEWISSEVIFCNITVSKQPIFSNRSEDKYLSYQCLFFRREFTMNRQTRTFSVDFPLLNTHQHCHLMRVQKKTVDLIRQMMHKDHQKCSPLKLHNKENQINFQEIENGLQDFNKHRIYAGSLALKLVDRPSSTKSNKRQNVPKSRSAYLTTYAAYNKQLQLCRGHSPTNKPEYGNILRKKTTVHRIIAPNNPFKQRLRLSLREGSKKMIGIQ